MLRPVKQIHQSELQYAKHVSPRRPSPKKLQHDFQIGIYPSSLHSPPLRCDRTVVPMIGGWTRRDDPETSGGLLTFSGHFSQRYTNLRGSQFQRPTNMRTTGKSPDMPISYNNDANTYGRLYSRWKFAWSLDCWTLGACRQRRDHPGLEACQKYRYIPTIWI
jgi:hypothetical protein